MTDRTPAISKELLKTLSTVKTWKWISTVALDWLVIAIVVASCLYWNRWFAWLVAILVIGNRQHALAILMHEGVHYRVSDRHWLNDLLSDLLTGYAVFMPTANYRVFHLDHHRWLDTPRDPEGRFFKAFPKDTKFPQSTARFAFVVLRDLSGMWPFPLGVLMKLIWGLPGQKRSYLLPIAALHGTVAATAYAMGGLHIYLLLWIVPLVTVFPAIFRIRAVAEHHGIEESGMERYAREFPDVLHTTRSIQGRVGRVLFGPHGMNYHLEHHLHPSVPFYNLPQLSRLLNKTAPLEIGPRIRNSYWRAIGECLDRSKTAADADGRRN